MRKIFYSIVGFILVGINYVSAIDYGTTRVDSGLVGSNETGDVAIQKLIVNAINFLYLLAVVYGLWGGFLILTAAGKEDQVKNGRTVIVQALLGLIVIFLASSVVGFLVKNILGVGN